MDMNGHILAGTTICVDYWQWTPQRKYTRFLSHLHADHTVGLTSTFSENIYTSPFNAWLLKRWFNIDPELVISLRVGNSHVIFDESSQSHFSVTLLEANHCPGSVMFLFQGLFGNILYTGDFRYNPDVLQHPMMKSVIENEAVDKLYLDNTFAAEHCDFPPRQQVLQDVITLIRNHPDHNVILGVRKLGKEEVLQAVALALKEKVWVTKERQQILSHLQYEDVFTTDQNESRIFAKDIHHITSGYVHNLQEEKGPVLIVLLTALYSVKPPGLNYSSKWDKITNNVYYLPYSAHSCHSELLRFVSIIKPHTIYPIVNSRVKNKTNIDNNKENQCINVLPLGCDDIMWKNSVLPESILKLATNPVDINDTVVNVEGWSNEDIVLKQNAISELTEDESLISCDNPDVGLKPRKSETLYKEYRTESVQTENNIMNAGNNVESQNESELVVPLGTSEMHPQTKLNDDEYAAMSEEDFTQLTHTQSLAVDPAANNMSNTVLKLEVMDEIKTEIENRDNIANFCFKTDNKVVLNQSPNLHFTQKSQEDSTCIQSQNINVSKDNPIKSTNELRISEKFSHLLGSPCECDSGLDCFCRAVDTNKHKDSFSSLENINDGLGMHNCTEMSNDEKRLHTRKHKQLSSYDTSTDNEVSSSSQASPCSRKRYCTNKIVHKKRNFNYSQKYNNSSYLEDSSTGNKDLSLLQALNVLQTRSANQIESDDKSSVNLNEKASCLQSRLQSLSVFLDNAYDSWKRDIVKKKNARAQEICDSTEEQAK